MIGSSLRGVTLLAALLPGCTKFASELDRPAGDEEIADPLQPISDLDWSCVPETQQPALPANTAQPITYALQIANLITQQPLANATVRACFRGDVECAMPIGPTLTSDATGVVQLTLFEGFNGFLEIRVEGMVPTLAFFPSAWSSELIPFMELLPVLLLPVQALPVLASASNVQIDLSAGLVSMYAYDCEGPSAAGVRLAIDSTSAVPYAFVDDLPVVGRDVTSESGIVGFVNVQPGI
ncbi:MAG: hypothetical protein ABW217_20815, partial [Polyangiaceae bacterium]